jgi:hypothetical protein
VQSVSLDLRVADAIRAQVLAKQASRFVLDRIGVEQGTQAVVQREQEALVRRGVRIGFYVMPHDCHRFRSHSRTTHKRNGAN